MAKFYLLTQEDIDALTTALDVDPARRLAQPQDEQRRQASEDAFRFYNYQVRAWIAKVTQ